MRFTANGSLAVLFATLTAVAQGSPTALVKKAVLDVWDPTIIQPTAETVWTVGQVEVVTWDTSNAPALITNSGRVTLEKNSTVPIDLTPFFDLRAANGSVLVTTPNVAPGKYKITLFGDSGNFSPTFRVKAA